MGARGHGHEHRHWYLGAKEAIAAIQPAFFGCKACIKLKHERANETLLAQSCPAAKRPHLKTKPQKPLGGLSYNLSDNTAFGTRK